MRLVRERGIVNTWPGFVDALANMLIVMIVVLLLFFVFQVYLGDTLSGRNKEIVALKSDLQELGNLLNLEKSAKFDTEKELSQLQASFFLLQSSEQGLREELALEREARFSEREQGEQNIANLQSEASVLQTDLSASQSRVSSLETDIQQANRAMQELQKQLVALNDALEVSEARDKASKATIKSLGERLNVALAGKIQELADYRSDFFGRLKKVLSAKDQIMVVGDRFVFSSEVLFDTGSSELQEDGKEQLSQLAKILIDLIGRIPEDINWVLQVEGHTDDVPIDTSLFSSNWELSSARAVSVVRHMISQGIPPDRLAVAGFAEYQPVADVSLAEDVEGARRKNRRIELRLTQH